jgi:hypothetical protein
MGFRYLNLEEDLSITETINVNPDPTQLPPDFRRFTGNQIVVNDDFSTENHFYGGQIGLNTSVYRGRWVLDLRGKIAFGVTHEIIDINGSTVITTPTGQVSTFRGGLLAQASNIGSFTDDVFAVVPEANVNLGYQLTNHLGVFIGYTFLYWSRVVRPGDQIDRGLPELPFFPTGIHPVGEPRPALNIKQTDFWAQGLNFGAELRW